jgi:hypothetical protein
MLHWALGEMLRWGFGEMLHWALGEMLHWGWSKEWRGEGEGCYIGGRERWWTGD